ncbi:helix-turn-helix transcriptional regulator [Soonwooa sp.]|uniref:helix-turn-helix transcriptional regulator n=1 Tax=Soonwooa sp. TaxID=1938592 RepID=UPI00263048B8|nr:helix-turn-helix transcriptional regulator [Soonwooa sp.]
MNLLTLRFNKIFLLVLLTFISQIHKGQKIDPEKSKQFSHYQKLVNTTGDHQEENNKNLLANAQTKIEIAWANMMMGGLKFQQGKYLDAIYYLEESDAGLKALDSANIRVYNLTSLTFAYRRAGLIEQSNEAWAKEQELYQKSNNKYKEAENCYNLSKMADIDEDYCKAAEYRKKYLKLVPEDVQKLDPNYIFAVYAQLGFAQVKCGNISNALASLEKAKQIASQFPVPENASLFEIYQLANALISIEQKDYDAAKASFSNAYNISRKNKSVAATKLILTERLNADIDPATDQLAFSKEIDEINKDATTVTKDLTKYESLKLKKKIEKQQNKTLIWSIISIISLLTLISILLYYTRLNKKRKEAYQRILERLDNKRQIIEQFSQEKSKQSVKQESSCDLVLNKELDNEAQIVKNLETLEEKHFFTSKNTTAPQLAVLLKITPRNLSYLLKKYRGEDFYNYINNLRIDYITSEIRSNAVLLNYKITVLSDMCGYNSHSQFATVFKSKTGISPSQFIDFVKKEKGQKDNS